MSGKGKKTPLRNGKGGGLTQWLGGGFGTSVSGPEGVYAGEKVKGRSWHQKRAMEACDGGPIAALFDRTPTKHGSKAVPVKGGRGRGGLISIKFQWPKAVDQKKARNEVVQVKEGNLKIHHEGGGTRVKLKAKRCSEQCAQERDKKKASSIGRRGPLSAP